MNTFRKQETNFFILLRRALWDCSVSKTTRAKTVLINNEQVCLYVTLRLGICNYIQLSIYDEIAPLCPILFGSLTKL